MQHSSLPVYSFNQNTIKRGEGTGTKMGVGEDDKTGVLGFFQIKPPCLQQASLPA